MGCNRTMFCMLHPSEPTIHFFLLLKMNLNIQGILVCILLLTMFVYFEQQLTGYTKNILVSE